MGKPKKELVFTRHFNAPKDLVFAAFASAEAMAEWWGPAEANTTVLSFDFIPGGLFHYKSEIKGHTSYGRLIYGEIRKPDLIEFTSSFSNEKAEVVSSPMMASWPKEIFNSFSFTESNGITTITIIGYPVNPTEEEYKTFVDLQPGVQKGMGGMFDQLQQYIEAQFQLRSKAKTTTMSRTSTYLNFDGNTEEAFLFYKSVFGTEFNGEGIKHFGDIPQTPGNPPVNENIKKMVLHVELPLLGNHILMGTDAPKEMGFTLNFGNNVHICLEPDSRKETERLFTALTAGGTVTMPLEDMFFGAYFGSCIDKFGVSWMFNCVAKDN
jgi:PhnB protein